MDVGTVITSLKNILGYPVAEGLYTGTEKKYITYVYQDERPFECADNKVLFDRVYVYVNLYVPRTYKYQKDKNTVRKYLENNNFLVSSVQPVLEESQKATQGEDYVRRVTFDCSIIVPRETEE